MTDTFLTQEVYTRLAWCTYSTRVPQPQSMATLLKDVSQLVETTRLSTHSLVHTLYYLTQLCRLCHDEELVPRTRSTAALFELVVVLMMVANKTNDDSSYTMKTWDNLTPLTTPTLKRLELAVLKAINYNVFLKPDQYTQFCDQLHTLAIHQGIIVDMFSPPQSQELLPVSLQPPTSMPSFKLSDHSSLLLHENYPLTPRSPVTELLQPLAHVSTQQYFPSLGQPAKRSLDGDEHTTNKRSRYAESYYTPPHMIIPTMTVETHPTSRRNGVIDHDNCSCCCLTNMTNDYHSSLKESKL